MLHVNIYLVKQKRPGRMFTKQINTLPLRLQPRFGWDESGRQRRISTLSEL